MTDGLCADAPGAGAGADGSLTDVHAIAWVPVLRMLRRLCRGGVSRPDAEHVALRLAHAGIFSCCARWLSRLREEATRPGSNASQLCCLALEPLAACATMLQLAPRLAQQCYQSGVVGQAIGLTDAALSSTVDVDTALGACDLIVKLALRGAASEADVRRACDLCARDLHAVLRRAPTPDRLAAGCNHLLRVYAFAVRGGVRVNQHRACETAHALGVAVGTLLCKRKGVVIAVRAFTARIHCGALLTVAAFIDGLLVATMVGQDALLRWLPVHAIRALRCALVVTLTLWAVPLLMTWRLCDHLSFYA